MELAIKRWSVDDAGEGGCGGWTAVGTASGVKTFDIAEI
jgi:hypothetical protein